MCSYSSLPTIDNELSIQAQLEDCPSAGAELDLSLALAGQAEEERSITLLQETANWLATANG